MLGVVGSTTSESFPFRFLGAQAPLDSFDFRFCPRSLFFLWRVVALFSFLKAVVRVRISLLLELFVLLGLLEGSILSPDQDCGVLVLFFV